MGHSVRRDDAVLWQWPFTGAGTVDGMWRRCVVIFQALTLGRKCCPIPPQAAWRGASLQGMSGYSGGELEIRFI